MNALPANTPCYVLLDGKQRLAPQLIAPDSGPAFVAIYGFSDKQPYDLFIADSKLALTPYPLVKGYLKNQIAESSDVIHLVVLDAGGPNESPLNAATMDSVLQAQQQDANQVSVSFRLTLDGDAKAYRVEKASSCLDETNRSVQTQGTS
ncbi:hypothetical protein NZK35_10290 [Stieleria sp. ICT_E10.1]|uniref:hypothetical protein n=1 Tax=Stieleria sedimenti TaxID=2976331 RepID=UPI00217F887F|nr:hypothetical protein [Stieleria sedimenti]MCS7467035.1 hypothetical protein [Stieleria sedimenti]